jgi:hypothetical protein
MSDRNKSRRPRHVSEFCSEPRQGPNQPIRTSTAPKASPKWTPANSDAQRPSQRSDTSSDDKVSPQSRRVGEQDLTLWDAQRLHPGAPVNGEALYNVRDLVKLPGLPRRRNGKSLHVSTIIRWCMAGLAHYRFGSTYCVYLSDLLKYCREQAERKCNAPAPSSRPTPPSKPRSLQGLTTVEKSKLSDLGLD